ncbi:thermonuclease family protein [Synechococcus sp. Lug-A]|uniref:thermonuclease family protein n=1 Tax=Synechococcus sp. Lug-A TaxID=2823740 RepID=UPI0028F430A3|nr:thermonuclease family protein [Synechococcus sp. Lug-A]MCP9846822.1 thermonuclease family protein [Synechococcus sp. Lug-A]
MPSSRPQAGTNIDLALVESGHAFVFRRFLNQCDAKAYLAAEQQAIRRRAGIWQVPGGLSRPWDFRRERRSGVTSLSADGDMQAAKEAMLPSQDLSTNAE